MTLLQVQNLSKAYYMSHNKSCLVVLDHINFEMKQEEFVSIVGPSGCGKSTFLKIIAGFEEKSAGTVLFENKEFVKPNRMRSYIPQDSGLFPWLSIEQNILICFSSSFKQEEKYEKTFWAMQKLGIEKFAKAYPKELSGGMKQRVALARAIAMDSKLILMDEPFSALDEISRTKIDKELKSFFVENKIATILVTHSIEEALYLSDRVCVLSASPSQIIEEIFPSKSDYKKQYDQILKCFE